MLARLEGHPAAAFVFIDNAPLLSRPDAWRDFVEHCAGAAPWVRAHYRETARFGHDHVWLRNDLIGDYDKISPRPEAPAEGDP